MAKLRQMFRAHDRPHQSSLSSMQRSGGGGGGGSGQLVQVDGADDVSGVGGFVKRSTYAQVLVWTSGDGHGRVAKPSHGGRGRRERHIWGR